MGLTLPDNLLRGLDDLGLAVVTDKKDVTEKDKDKVGSVRVDIKEVVDLKEVKVKVEKEKEPEKPKRRRNRAAISCVHCKSKKIKCSRTRNCSTCAIKGIECVWAPGTFPSAEANIRDVEAAGILKRIWARDTSTPTRHPTTPASSAATKILPESSTIPPPKIPLSNALSHTTVLGHKPSIASLHSVANLQANLQSPIHSNASLSSLTIPASAIGTSSRATNHQPSNGVEVANTANAFYQDLYASLSSPPGWPTALPTSLAQVPASWWMVGYDEPSNTVASTPATSGTSLAGAMMSPVTMGDTPASHPSVSSASQPSIFSNMSPQCVGASPCTTTVDMEGSPPSQAPVQSAGEDSWMDTLLGFKDDRRRNDLFNIQQQPIGNVPTTMGLQDQGSFKFEQPTGLTGFQHPAHFPLPPSQVTLDSILSAHSAAVSANPSLLSLHNPAVQAPHPIPISATYPMSHFPVHTQIPISPQLIAPVVPVHVPVPVVPTTFSQPLVAAAQAQAIQQLALSRQLAMQQSVPLPIFHTLTSPHSAPSFSTVSVHGYGGVTGATPRVSFADWRSVCSANTGNWTEPTTVSAGSASAASRQEREREREMRQVKGKGRATIGDGIGGEEGNQSRFSMAQFPFLRKTPPNSTSQLEQSSIPFGSNVEEGDKGKKRRRPPSNDSRTSSELRRLFNSFSNSTTSFIFPSLSRRQSQDVDGRGAPSVRSGGSSDSKKSTSSDKTTGSKNSWHRFLASLTSRSGPVNKRRAVWESPIDKSNANDATSQISNGTTLQLDPLVALATAGVQFDRPVELGSAENIKGLIQWDQTLLAEYNQYLTQGLNTNSTNQNSNRL